MPSEIQELIDAVADDRLKKRFAAAIAELKKTKKFGLVFEKHIPELLPLYRARIRSQMRVARKQGGLTDTYIVNAFVRNMQLFNENTIQKLKKSSLSMTLSWSNASGRPYSQRSGMLIVSFETILRLTMCLSNPTIIMPCNS
jgi:hypothetical protein